MSEGFKDYVEQRAMTDHAQWFYLSASKVVTDWFNNDDPQGEPPLTAPWTRVRPRCAISRARVRRSASLLIN